MHCAARRLYCLNFSTPFHLLLAPHKLERNVHFWDAIRFSPIASSCTYTSPPFHFCTCIFDATGARASCMCIACEMHRRSETVRSKAVQRRGIRCKKEGCGLRNARSAKQCLLQRMIQAYGVIECTGCNTPHFILRLRSRRGPWMHLHRRCTCRSLLLACGNVFLSCPIPIDFFAPTVHRIQ